MATFTGVVGANAVYYMGWNMPLTIASYGKVILKKKEHFHLLGWGINKSLKNPKHASLNH